MPLRLASMCAAAVALTALLGAGRCGAAPGPVQPEPTAPEILYGVSADDGRWYHVLNQMVKMDEATRAEPAAKALLDELGLGAAAEFRVQPVVRHLVTRPGSTGSQYRFGVAVLGAGLACQLVRTVLLHTYFAGLYAVRDHVDVSGVRHCMSHVQVAMAGYLDQLSFFGEHPAVPFLVDVSRKMNAVFAECDAQPKTVHKSALVEVIRNVCNGAIKLLADRCVAATQKDIAPTVHVTSYSDKIFTDRTEVEDHQLLAMIENLDPYEHVEFSTMGRDFWIKWLDIKPFKMLDDNGQSDKDE